MSSSAAPVLNGVAALRMGGTGGTGRELNPYHKMPSLREVVTGGTGVTSKLKFIYESV